MITNRSLEIMTTIVDRKLRYGLQDHFGLLLGNFASLRRIHLQLNCTVVVICWETLDLILDAIIPGEI